MEPDVMAVINTASNRSSVISLLSLSVCMCISPIVARQWLGKHVPVATNTRSSRRIVVRVIFYAIRVVSKESRRTVIPRTSCTLFIK
jgi:hypothetical protein